MAGKTFLISFYLCTFLYGSVLQAQYPFPLLHANAKPGNSRRFGYLDPAGSKLPWPEDLPSSAGRKGWKVTFPKCLPLTSPAIHRGKLYIGAGFGSRSFHALDSETDEGLWDFHCSDDGPTFAVALDDYVAYNTESCTIFLHEASTGKLLWARWMGDPLMSAPALADGKVFMAYPSSSTGHHLCALDIKTGKTIWDKEITGEVITAPVIVQGVAALRTTDNRNRPRPGIMTLRDVAPCSKVRSKAQIEMAL